MARASVTSDIFNAVAEVHRREILDVLVAGERPVGELADVLRLAQPQVSKHLRVLSDVGLVKCRAEGRRRLYRLEQEPLRPLHDWMEKYERSWNQRLDRLDDYVTDLKRKEENL
jgi:DNA-binding transcriptional ArsR family regulator